MATAKRRATQEFLPKSHISCDREFYCPRFQNIHSRGQVIVIPVPPTKSVLVLSTEFPDYSTVKFMRNPSDTGYRRRIININGKTGSHVKFEVPDVEGSVGGVHLRFHAPFEDNCSLNMIDGSASFTNTIGQNCEITVKTTVPRINPIERASQKPIVDLTDSPMDKLQDGDVLAVSMSARGNIRAAGIVIVEKYIGGRCYVHSDMYAYIGEMMFGSSVVANIVSIGVATSHTAIVAIKSLTMKEINTSDKLGDISMGIWNPASRVPIEMRVLAGTRHVFEADIPLEKLDPAMSPMKEFIIAALPAYVRIPVND
jgi:hypothetical protein